MGIIRVEHAGMLTTIQDLGRWGYGRFGMPVAGVMDEYAARIANILLQNSDNTPVLEITLMGPTLSFEADMAFVITGGNLGPCLNNETIKLWTVYQAKPDDTLRFTGVTSGCRAYIAVAGGFDVKPVMGSASTYLRGKLGGYDGRAIRVGDVLHTSPISSQASLAGSALPDEYLPDDRTSIRVVLGPQDDAFTQEGLHTFFNSEYTVTSEADRMGYRLDGPKIAHKHSADIISDGIALGAVQVPAHGTPIIMLADHQTTGGYTKIGNVISVDIPTIAQKKPGDRIQFEHISVQEAQRLYREREQMLERVRQFLKNTSKPALHYLLTVNGQPYHVSIREM